MAGEARKLAKKLQVPPSFTKGVGDKYRWVKDDDGFVRKIRDTERSGAEVDAVRDRSDVILVKMESALEKWKKAKSEGKDVNASMKPLDEMAELVRRAAIESKDEGGAVVAHVASALMRLPADDRMVVLRHAGRPELFEPLLEGGLAEPPLRGGVGNEKATQTQRLSKATETIKAEKGEEFAVDQLPLVQRPSSVFVEPERYSSSGSKVDSTGTYKGHLPKEGNTPLAVKAKRGKSPVHGMITDPETGEVVQKVPRGGSGGLTGQDIEFFGMTEAADSTKRSALNRLADDQIAQVKAIEAKAKRGESPPPTLPIVVRSKKKDARLDEFDGDNAITAGASQRPGAGWSGRYPLEIEDEVARRQRSESAKFIGMLYDMTEPTKIDNRRLSVSSEEAVDAGLSGPTINPESAIDLDRYIPWWRGRFAQLDARGRYQYPARMPSAQFLAGIIQGRAGIPDPDFVERIAPLIQRSIDAAPDAPDLGLMIKDPATNKMRPFDPEADRGLEAEAVVTSSAGKYSRKVFLLSKDMETAMKAGVGTPDYPYPVYGERQVPRERVVKPVRTLAEQKARAGTAASQPQNDARARVKSMMQNADQPAEAAPQNTLDKMQKARERMKKFRDGPGTGDTSSIYSVPPSSPMRSLLA